MEYNLENVRRYLNFPLRVFSVADRERNTYCLRNERIQYLFLSFVLKQESEMVTVVDGIVHRAFPRCAHMGIVRPGTVINVLHGSARRELFFRYSPDAVEFFDSLGFEDCYFKQTPGFDEAMARLKKDLERLSEPGRADRIDLLAVELAGEAMLSSRSVGRGVSEAIPDERIFRIAHHIDLNYMHSVELEKLIRAQSMTPRTFYREWEKYYSVTPAQYLMNVRIARAKELLSTSSMKIYEVAEQCGFCDAMYFSRCFTIRTGHTPRAYRLSVTG